MNKYRLFLRKSFSYFLIAVLIIAGCAFFVPEKIPLVYKVRAASIKTAHPGLVIMLHGLGSNEDDMFGLATHLPKEMIVVSARAPITLAKDSYAWYKVDRSNGKFIYDASEAERARVLISQFIDAVSKKFRIDAKRIFLLGFSQGAIMSYSVALSQPEKVKGIMALSGRLMAESRVKTGNPDKLKQLQAFIAHGTDDEILPVTDSREAAAFCTSKGVQVLMKEYPIKHQISAQELADLLRWLNAQNM